MSSKAPYRRRQRQVLIQGLLTLLFISGLALAYYFLLRDPSLVPRDFPIDLPQDKVTGVIGEDSVNGAILLRVTHLERIASESLSLSERLGARAKPGPTVDYLILDLHLSNRGEKVIPFAYVGSSQTVDLRLGRRRPRPSVKLPVYPEESARITGEKALSTAQLEPGQSLEGKLVFPINRASKELSLLVLPAARFRDDPDAFPAFEITLSD